MKKIVNISKWKDIFQSALKTNLNFVKFGNIPNRYPVEYIKKKIPEK